MRDSRMISRNDIMILLNNIYLSDKPFFNVRYPLYDLNLFNVNLGKYELKNIIRNVDFERARTKYVPDSDFLSSDLPRYSDLRDCFITSAFLKFPNFEKVKRELLYLAETIMSPGGRAKPLYLALDTNMVYLKFFSRYFPLEGPDEKKVTAIDFRIALSDMVKEEIDAQIKYKYRASNINRMKKAMGHKEIVDQFFNASCRKTRIAKSAQNEIKLLFAALEAERAESLSFVNDREERDRLIAKSYSNFEKERNGEVLLITADEDMAYHAKNAGLHAETLLVPHVIPTNGRIKQSRLVNLIYDLAIAFGVVRLTGTGVTVFGEWKGKGFEDYSRERVNLTIEGRSRIKEDFERDLRIADKIDAIT